MPEWNGGGVHMVPFKIQDQTHVENQDNIAAIAFPHLWVTVIKRSKVQIKAIDVSKTEKLKYWNNQGSRRPSAPFHAWWKELLPAIQDLVSYQINFIRSFSGLVVLRCLSKYLWRWWISRSARAKPNLTGPSCPRPGTRQNETHTSSILSLHKDHSIRATESSEHICTSSNLPLTIYQYFFPLLPFSVRCKCLSQIQISYLWSKAISFIASSTWAFELLRDIQTKRSKSWRVTSQINQSIRYREVSVVWKKVEILVIVLSFLGWANKFCVVMYVVKWGLPSFQRQQKI